MGVQQYLIVVLISKFSLWPMTQIILFRCLWPSVYLPLWTAVQSCSFLLKKILRCRSYLHCGYRSHFKYIFCKYFPWICEIKSFKIWGRWFISLFPYSYCFLCSRSFSSPGWCGSVDWALLACEPKGRQFDSQSGHMPGLQARLPVGTLERQPHTDVSLSPSLPSKNK